MRSCHSRQGHRGCRCPKCDCVSQDDAEQEVDGYLRRKYTTAIRDIETVSKEDLDLKNHLSGLQRKLLKVRAPL